MISTGFRKVLKRGMTLAAVDGKRIAVDGKDVALAEVEGRIAACARPVVLHFGDQKRTDTEAWMGEQ